MRIVIENFIRDIDYDNVEPGMLDLHKGLKKANISDSFELLYIRHNYFKRSTNPSNERLAKFEEMLQNISKKIYYRNRSTFNTTGFELEDVINVARIHTVSFISISGIRENEDKMKQFVKSHKKKYGKKSYPKEQDFFLKEHYDLAKFLNQRLNEFARACESKNKNIRGTKSFEVFYKKILDIDVVEPSDHDLIRNPTAYGYKKIEKSEFRKMAGRKGSKNNKKVRAIYRRGSFLTKEDIEDRPFYQGNSYFYMNPEDILMDMEE